MSFQGRLTDLMHEALVIAPGGHYGDTPGPLYNLPREQSSIAVDRAVEIALLFVEEAERRALARGENLARAGEVEPVVDEVVTEPEHP